MHSPWGLLYSIIKETGWTWHYLMWKVSWINVEMMLKDQPRYKTKKGKGDDNKTKMATSFEDFKDFGD